MHILVVNDDGPPSKTLSPYVRPFVNALQDAGHRVSVAIPATSRSWIGKAHIIGASLTATYVHPGSFLDDGTWIDENAVHERGIQNDSKDEVTSSVFAAHRLPPTPDASSEHLLGISGSRPETTPPLTTATGTTTTTNPAAKVDKLPNQDDYWVVVSNGTPASCAQLGLYELFRDRGPIDLVVSGPNHGRNASTIYNLSSGTVGGALEAATCGKRGIALSFGSKEAQPPQVIAAASRLSTRVIEHLYRNWSSEVELYNLNVPMREDVELQPVRYSSALRNEWTKGSLYAEVQMKNDDVPQPVDEARHQQVTVNQPSSPPTPPLASISTKTKQPARIRHFQWSAELSDIKKSLAESPQGTDARTVLDGHTSVTPLKANFWHPPGFSGDLQLDI